MHTIEVQYNGRTWKLKGTQVTVTMAAPCQSSSICGISEGSSIQLPVTVVGPLSDVCEEDIELTLSDEDDSDENDPRTATSANSTTTINWESGFSDIVFDARTQPRFPAQLLIRNPSHSSPASFIKAFMPVTYIRDVIIPATNRHATAINMPYWYELTVHELRHWMGIWWALCVCHISSCTNAWQVEPKDSLTPALNFGQFGMSNQRFEAITSAIALSTYPPPYPDDQFWEIRPFIEA